MKLVWGQPDLFPRSYAPTSSSPLDFARGKKEQPMSVKQLSLEWGGRTLTVETGKFAKQTNASCTVRFGDTVLLATVVKSKNTRDGIDFFPLMVNFEECLYAAGKIKGSRFIKREGRPSDDAILS